MVAQRTRTKLTYADYAKTPEGEIWQLIDGELIMAAAPNIKHQRIQARLGAWLLVHVEERGLGMVFFSPTDVVLSDTEVVQPDLLFVSNERSHLLTVANVRGAPDLVVEILSPSTAMFDWRHKLDMYERHGVREYVLADPESETVWVFQLTDGRFALAGRYGVGDTLTLSTVDGFSIPLAEVFGS